MKYMKIRIQKITLLILGVVASLIVNAQTIEVSATVAGVAQPIANGSVFNAASLGPVTLNLKDYLPLTVTIKNTSATDPLELEAVAGKYVVLSGTGASDFIINETGITSSTIAPKGSKTFTISLSSTATNGPNKTVSISIKSNSEGNSTDGVYAGSITYNLSGIPEPEIGVSATVAGITQEIDNGTVYNAASLGPITLNLSDYLPITITINNTSSTDPLILETIDGKYIGLSGTGASDFTIDETGISSSTIEPNGSKTFTITLSSVATNGSNKTVSMSIKSNSVGNSTAGMYVGSITYNLSNITTSITKASDIGLSLFPNPSKDGNMQLKANNVIVNKIVVSNIAGQTEEFTTTQFATSLKGLLLVKLYTDKGVVSEKIIIQE